jgi:EthD domain
VIKLVSLMSRRPGTSMAAFRRYYEEQHVPLVARLLPPAQDYRRNYAVEDGEHRPGHGAVDRAPAERLFDVLTELTYATREDYDRVLAALSDPAVGRLLAEDEERFLDRTTIRSYVVEEFRSP